jgi:hypothetical protein
MCRNVLRPLIRHLSAHLLIPRRLSRLVAACVLRENILGRIPDWLRTSRDDLFITAAA